jgi:hypothetical protein
MRLIGCDLHATQQSIAMLDRDTGVVVEKTLTHEGGAVREFYASIPPPGLRLRRPLSSRSQPRPSADNRKWRSRRDGYAPR